MKIKIFKEFGAVILACVFPYTGFAQQQSSPDGCCGDRKSESPSVRNDVLGITQKIDTSLDTAFTRLQEQIDTIEFDSEAIGGWIGGLEPGNVDLPFIDEAVINNVAEAVPEWIDRAEELLQEGLTAARGATETALRTSFNNAMSSFVPGGNFQADVSWKIDCCETTAFWSSPYVQLAGSPTSVKGTADFEAEISVGPAVGITATADASVNFGLELDFGITDWSNERFWPSPSGIGDTSNREGCSVQVRARPDWEATYLATGGGGALLTVTLGIGATASNDPNLPEVTTTLSIPQ